MVFAGLQAFQHFYPRPPRGGRRQPFRVLSNGAGISIHVLREEDDPPDFLQLDLAQKISIHVLREEDDGDTIPDNVYQIAFLSTSSARRTTAGLSDVKAMGMTFLSTSSARRTTKPVKENDHAMDDFYPRPPRGGRLPISFILAQEGHFYPRPPRGGRLLPQIGRYDGKRFLSTSSARRTTKLTFFQHL